MELVLRRFDDPEAFAEAAMLFLLEHEAEHCLPIGVVAQAIENPARWEGPITFATVERDGDPVAAAIRTPPFEPVFSRVDDPAAIPLLVDLFLEDETVGGFMAPVEVGSLLAEEWGTRTGCSVAISMPERIYKVEKVEPVLGVPGILRRATIADRDLLIAWNEAFVAEAFGERAVPGQAARGVDSRLTSAQSGFAFWEDGEPVCVVGFSGPTPDGIRIGPVYTPPAFRRRGYGSAATAALSRELIDEGRRFCVLFADLDNPTSNHIYQEIGYRPVADIAVYKLTR
ncbi:MAG: GNAT family N-acetyltransferase [Thermomicrobiales bacterium]|nr:GNAT family N-acetyltransferase [Thermomicrobiales bacterium]